MNLAVWSRTFATRQRTIMFACRTGHPHRVQCRPQTPLQKDTYNKTCQLIVSLTPQPSDCGLTNGQESADLALLDRTYHIADTGCRCGNREVERWLTGEQKQHIFWLGGLAGTGKSIIARHSPRRALRKDSSVLEAIFPKGAAPLKVTQHQENRAPLSCFSRLIAVDPA